MPSFKKDAWQKAVDTFLKIRDSPSVLGETDVVIMLDGYKHGLKPQILGAFGQTMKDETTYSLIYDADQLQSRLGCVRGWKMQQVEWMHAMHNPNGLALRIRNRCPPFKNSFLNIQSLTSHSKAQKQRAEAMFKSMVCLLQKMLFSSDCEAP